MKKICIIVIFLFSAMNLSAQSGQHYLSGLYSFQLLGSKNDRFKERYCTITFFKDNTYQMDISFRTGYTFGGGATLTLSVGTFDLRRNNILVLKDAFNNFEMTFRRQGATIIPVKTFAFCNNKIFEKKEALPYANFDRLNSNALQWIETINNEKQLFLKKLNINYLQTGIYKDPCVYRSTVVDYNVNIREDKTFQVIIQNIPILKGTWKRKGKELLLYDTTLQHTFWLLIDKDRLMGNLFVSSKINHYFYLEGVEMPVELCQGDDL